MNRFLIREREIDRPDPRLFPGLRPRVARQQTKQSKCPQFSELEVAPNDFVLDVLAFFFEERLTPERLNDRLRDLAARTLYEAKKASKAMDAVPRTAGWKPTVTWLVSQAVQLAFRAEQNKCIYEAVRVTVARNFKSEYVLARDLAAEQSVSMMEALMKPSKRGIEMLKGFEGFRAHLYDGPAGNCHIGYGHLVHRGACDGSEPAEFKAGITEARATQLLESRAERCARVLHEKVTVPLSQCQLDALVSFCMNVGEGNFAGSTLLKKLNEGDHVAVPLELRKWVRAGGKVLAGLERRRAVEAAVYEHCTYPATSKGLSLGEAGGDPESRDEGELEDGVHVASMTLTMEVPAFCGTNAAETAGTSHFDLAEFGCRDGTPVPKALRGYVQELMEQLEILRSELGDAPIEILSGYRTPRWNERLKGATRSRHLCAQAADIRVQGHTPEQVHAAIERLVQQGRMREGGLGRYPTFTHYDIRGSRARW